MPSTPPGDIITHSTSNTSVVIEWDPPTQPNGAITRYTIYLISTVNRTIYVDGRFTLAYITELSAAQTIGIMISASNDAGEGVTSMYINYQPYIGIFEYMIHAYSNTILHMYKVHRRHICIYVILYSSL